MAPDFLTASSCGYDWVSTALCPSDYLRECAALYNLRNGGARVIDLCRVEFHEVDERGLRASYVRSVSPSPVCGVA